MKHKLAMLQELVKQMGHRSVGKMHSHKKPLLSVHVEKHDDDTAEESLLNGKMKEDDEGEDNELKKNPFK